MPCKKAKLLRKERKQNKLLAQGKTQEEIEAMFKGKKQQTPPKSIEELFNEMYGGTNRLEVGFALASSSTSLRTMFLKYIGSIYWSSFLQLR